MKPGALVVLALCAGARAHDIASTLGRRHYCLPAAYDPTEEERALRTWPCLAEASATASDARDVCDTPFPLLLHFPALLPDVRLICLFAPYPDELFRWIRDAVERMASHHVNAFEAANGDPFKVIHTADPHEYKTALRWIMLNHPRVRAPSPEFMDLLFYYRITSQNRKVFVATDDHALVARYLYASRRLPGIVRLVDILERLGPLKLSLVLKILLRLGSAKSDSVGEPPYAEKLAVVLLQREIIPKLEALTAGPANPDTSPERTLFGSEGEISVAVFMQNFYEYYGARRDALNGSLRHFIDDLRNTTGDREVFRILFARNPVALVSSDGGDSFERALGQRPAVVQVRDLLYGKGRGGGRLRIKSIRHVLLRRTDYG